MSKFDFLGKKGTPEPEQPKAPGPRLGRPTGKRSDPDMVQVTAYIRKQTHVRAKRALLDEAEANGDKREFSELIEALLTDWLRKNAKV